MVMNLYIERLQQAITGLKAVRICLQYHVLRFNKSAGHDWYAFKGDSGRWYALPDTQMVKVPTSKCLLDLDPLKMPLGWHPARVRTVTVGDLDWNVCAQCGVLDLGKFQGDKLHAVRDWYRMLEGDVDESTDGAFKVDHRYYEESNDGFVTEIDAYEFARIRDLAQEVPF